MSNLREDLEVTLSEAHPSLAEVSAFSTGVLAPLLVVCLLIGFGRGGELVLEGIETGLSISNVGKKIKVVVEEVCASTTRLEYIRGGKNALIRGRTAYKVG